MAILIVEDDTDLLRLMERMVRIWGFDPPITACDGDQALPLCDAQQPDLIITDFHMPRLDGLAFTRALRARGNKTPVVLLTADGDWQLDELAEAAGVDRVIKKPINVSELYETIREVYAE